MIKNKQEVQNMTCEQDCRCPLCDETMAAVARMNSREYAAWLATTQAVTARAMQARRLTAAEKAEPVGQMVMRTVRGEMSVEPSGGKHEPTPEELAERRAGIAAAKRKLEALKRERQRPKLNATQRRVNTETLRDADYAANNIPDPYQRGLEELRQRNERKEIRR